MSEETIDRPLIKYQKVKDVTEIKVVILTEGGEGIGFGHITRCLSLYQGFAAKGITPEFIVRGDESIEYLLKEYPHSLDLWTKDAAKLAEKIKGYDVAIVDSYLTDIAIYEAIEKLVRLPFWLDDYMRLNYPRGIVLNGAVEAEKLDYPAKEHVEYLLGVDFIPLRRTFWNVATKNIPKDIQHILITFGGDDVRKMTARIMHFINQGYPEIQKHVVIGKGFKNIQEIEKAADSRTRLHYFPSAEDMKSLMHEVDLAISASGQTLYELARVGAPTIAIAVADNQLNNVKGWQNANFILYGGWWEDKNLLYNLTGHIKLLSSQTERIERSQKGQNFVDGLGCRRVVEIIIDQATRQQRNNKTNSSPVNGEIVLRKAGKKDCYDLWNWRNHPHVRQWCFQSTYIGYKQHCDWFSQRLDDARTLIYIAENRRGEKIGQVRFDIVDGEQEAVININLNPYFLHKGYGSKIIYAATETFLNECPNIKTIEAEIFENNLISQKAFQKAGYRKFQNIVKRQQTVVIYKYDPDRTDEEQTQRQVSNHC